MTHLMGSVFSADPRSGGSSNETEVHSVPQTYNLLYGISTDKEEGAVIVSQPPRVHSSVICYYTNSDTGVRTSLKVHQNQAESR